MYLPKIHTSEISLRYSRSTNSSSLSNSSIKSKESNPTSVLIQLCLHSDENYSCRSMKILLSTRYNYSPNVTDEFGCNLLMYTLRYQRYRLLDYLLENYFIDLNFQAKDHYGNTLLHYAIIYSGMDTKILENLIDKYRKYGIRIDERNHYGFTPLLLAAFCGRYNFVLTFLTKTDSSPFVRDYLHRKNIFDYIEMDLNKKTQMNIIEPDEKTKRSFYQTLPSQDKIYLYKNFFQLFFIRTIEDQTNFYRSSIVKFYHSDYLSHVLRYLNQRYPQIKTPRQIKESTTTFLIQRENSNLNVHQLLTLFDPSLKPKAMIPEKKILPSKTNSTFRKLGTKITTMSAFSKTQIGKKRSSLTSTPVK